MAGPFDTVLRHLRALTSGAESEPDALLLQRFAARRDEVAFALLLRRHGPLVWDVCRHVLRHEQDAEDAFQATFLVLAEKAGAIRKQEALACWLHGVAFRVSAKARTGAARRRSRERQAAEMPRAQPADEPSDPEVRAALHEELQQLPQGYRTALILFYLEGKSCEETARQLGCPLGTVRSRLARGRELLRSRLAGRGVSISPALLAPLSSAGVVEVVPPALASATLQAALLVGDRLALAVASPRALALADQLLRASAWPRKGALALLLLLGLTTLGTGLLLHGRAEEQPAAAVLPTARKAPALLRAAPDPNAPPVLSAVGRVQDAAGRPLAGATVILREWPSWSTRPAEAVLAQTRTDAGGRFRFAGVPSRPLRCAWHVREHPWEVVAQAPGRGLAWRHLTAEARQRPFTLTLTPAARLEGQLLGPAGQAVAGGYVEPIQVEALRPVAVDLPAWRQEYLDLRNSRPTLAVRSNAAGRFALDGLPPGVRVWLRIRAPGYLERTVLAATVGDPQPSVITRFQLSGRRVVRLEPVRTGPLLLRLQPGRRVRGQVLGPNGAGVAGARVRGRGQVATADAAGQFTLGGLPLGPCLLAAWDPAEGTQLVGAVTRLNIPADRPEVGLTVRLERGRACRGRVVDALTGRGVGGVNVFWLPLPGRWSDTPFIPAVTRRDGSFRLVVPAGTVRVAASGLGVGYPEQTTQDVAAWRPAPLTIPLWPRVVLVVRGRVLDPQGRPVQGAEVALEHHSDPGHPVRLCAADARGRFTLAGVPPGPNCEWVVTDPRRPLGARVPATLPAGAVPPEQEVRLRPLAAVAGRVVDAAGQPLPGAAVRVWVRFAVPGGSPREIVVPTGGLSTGADGTFRFTGLLPGPRARYTVEVSANGRVGRRSAAFAVAAGRTQRLADLVLPASVSVAGTAVDEEGRPLPEVRVGVVPGPEDGLLRPLPVVTAGDGRFRIEGLPPGPVQLEAERFVAAQPEPVGVGQARLRVEAGRRDVRIVLRAKK
jgi:RNA polymerase sigma factor (sigma-70 family)